MNIKPQDNMVTEGKTVKKKEEKETNLTQKYNTNKLEIAKEEVFLYLFFFSQDVQTEE